MLLFLLVNNTKEAVFKIHTKTNRLVAHVKLGAGVLEIREFREFKDGLKC